MASGKTHQTRRGKSRERKRSYEELTRIAEEMDAGRVTVNTAPQVLQECLDRSVEHLRVARMKVDEIPEDEFWKSTIAGEVPHHWYQLELNALDRCERIAGLIEKLDLEARIVRLEEAKAALVVASVRRAAEKAGLSQAMIRRLGAALRDEVALLTAGQEVSA